MVSVGDRARSLTGPGTKENLYEISTTEYGAGALLAPASNGRTAWVRPDRHLRSASASGGDPEPRATAAASGADCTLSRRIDCTNNRGRDLSRADRRRQKLDGSARQSCRR